ncbi:hypothetical protein L6452_36358 [Arctium lappa]|uniref:Uncharacterized protein n=1 Tax=Arctium lappa TaxID=4217 RepID=A0ACB8Y943_ARCLA|nr:hypothetical protein L6452_36358 [Arctium lappa]
MKSKRKKEAIVLGDDNGLSLKNIFKLETFGGMINFDPGLVDNGEPGSCNLLILLLVSFQNFADTLIPLGPFCNRFNPPFSWTPEVLPEDTLSVSILKRLWLRTVILLVLSVGFQDLSLVELSPPLIWLKIGFLARFSMLPP